MSALNRAYGLVARAAASTLRLAGPLNAKLAQGVAARRNALARLEDWAREARDPDRPLIWLHAPSVGEALMAQAIAGALRTSSPEAQLALTIFSPSAERLLARAPVDVAGYLPWDTPKDAVATVRALRPSAVGFVRTEVWPLMMAAAQRAGARAALVNAVLAPTSSRLRWPARALLDDFYVRLDAVGAVSAAHAARFQMLNVPAERVRVTGDARFDQVLQRVAEIDRDAPMLARLRAPGVPVLIAGSTWPPDDDLLIEALTPLLREGRLRLVIAPHEPSDAALDILERKLDQAELTRARLVEVERGGHKDEPAVVVVERVGVLADLYASGSIAYVGGGFGTAGLHSVVEPAALSVPVLFGPKHGNAIEATELAEAGGAVTVTTSGGLRAAVVRWLDDGASRTSAGRAALEFTRSRAGGAEANARLLTELAAAAAHRS
ncbi:MAG: hypothetical protein GX539_01890 [Candidatus Cloacimonetes bacterium]|nr:hypothetical protein [Candidatus Cloacimonadota bacterium]